MAIRIPGPQDVQLPQSRRIATSPDKEFNPTMGNIARGMSAIVSELEGRRQKADDAGFFANVAASSSQAYLDVYDEHAREAPSGEEFTQGLDEKLAKTSEQVIERAKKEGGYKPSEEALQRVNLQLGSMRGDYLAKAAAYQNNARVEKATDDTLTYMKQLASTAYYDPSALTDNILKAEEAAEGLRAIAPEDVATGTLEDAKRQITLTAVNGMIDRDPQSALEFLEQNQKNPNISPEDHISLTRTANARLSQAATKMEAQAKREAKELVSDTILSFESGYPVPEREYQSAIEAASLVNKTEDLQVARAASRYILLPKAARDGLPEQAEGVDQAELRQALEKADETINRELSKDGYAFAVRQGVVDKVELNLNDPETVRARLEQTDYLKTHYGKEVSPLTSEEADLLVDTLPDMSPGEKAQLAAAFGPSEEIWKQLDSKNAGTFAMVGAIGDPDVMSSVFKGQKLMEDKLVSLPEDQNTLLAAFDDAVGSIYVGRDRKAMFEAATAYYASQQGPNAPGGWFAKDTFEDAIEAVSGGIGTINGSKVELPRGLEEDIFEDFIDGFTPEMVEHFGGVWSMSNEEAAAMIQDAAIRSIGSNRYVVERNGAVLFRPDSQQFIFSFDPELFEQNRKPKDEPQPRTRSNRGVR